MTKMLSKAKIFYLLDDVITHYFGQHNCLIGQPFGQTRYQYIQ